MPKEIERKFLVKRLESIPLQNGLAIKQGYIPTYKRTKTAVRIRLYGDNAFLTIKGKSKGATRSEFEYAIPVEEAHQMIRELCGRSLIEKVRYKIDYSGVTWEVDVFEGQNEGLILAEVELESEDQAIVLPDWVDKEVTDDQRYYNANLVVNPFKRWK